MRTVSLQQICDIQIGKTPSRSVPEYWGGELPWVTISDFAAGRVVTTTKERITRIGAVKSGSKRIPRGTLLLSFKLSLGKRAFSGCDLFTNEAIAALHVLDRNVVDRDYLYWALGSIDYDRLVDRAAKGKTLNKAKLRLLKVPLPSLAEQKRIAGILESADILLAKRRESIGKLDTLLQSTFLEMFGDPVRSGWTMVTVEAVASSQSGAIRTGPFGSQLLHSEFVDEGICVLGIDNAVANEFRAGEPRFITRQKYDQLRRYTVRPGDVLITIMGTCGRCAVVPDGLPTAINTKHLCCVTLDHGRCLPEFMHAYFLEHPIARRYLERSAKGAIMSGLNMRIIKALPIPAAPLELQRRFASIVLSVEQKKTSQRAHLAELDTLFASLQSRAFRGDL